MALSTRQSAASSREKRHALLQLKRLCLNEEQKHVCNIDQNAAKAAAIVRDLQVAQPGSLRCLEAVREVRRLLCLGPNPPVVVISAASNFLVAHSESLVSPRLIKFGCRCVLSVWSSRCSKHGSQAR